MPRSYSRRRARKGGDTAQIIDLQTKVEKIEKQLSDVKSELNSLEKQDIEASIEKPKSDDEEVEKTKETIIEDPSDNEEETKETEEIKEKEIPLTQQKIDVTGFQGSVGDAMQSIKGKMRQLQKPSNKGRYDEKANKFKQSLAEMKAAKSISDIEEIINKTPSLNFKNNKLMGGKKTKKRHHRKGKKSRRP
jgi:small-conductance mechanosensitive channel